ncbi:ArsB/NhaD family transporter [Paenibacillus sp. R14(2021)]|uniref:ArsB/NhaD family transporter n=1 Tax=Paenibacillus sp. R14(2021) TaxID=2859228 RepID=UPI001C612704
MAVVLFTCTIPFTVWRPQHLFPILPSTAGAVVLIAAGIVPSEQLIPAANIVSGAAITILASCPMSILLDSIGFCTRVRH